MKFRKVVTNYFIAAGLPVFIMLVVFANLHIYPFGPKSILSGDLLGQYISIMNYVGGGKIPHLSDLLYSNSVGLGINFYPVITYYISSPINLLLLFFNASNMPLFFEFNILIDVSLISLAMYYFLKQSNFVSCKSNEVALFGAVAFSLSAYVFSYQSCVMWINSIIFLPLIVLGFEKIISGNSGVLYYVSILLAIVSNYYIGIIIILFLFILGIFWVIFTKKNRILIKRGIRLTIITLFALASSAFILIPSYLAQKSVDQSKFSLTFEKMYPLRDAIKGVIINPNTNNVPIIFCGIVTIILLILFIFNDRVAKKEKIFVVTFIAFLCISTEVSFLYMAWHMFSMPNGFPQRESFVISFVLVVVAVKELCLLKENLSSEEKRIVLISGLIWIGLLACEYLIHNLSFKLLLLNMLMILLYVLVFMCGVRRRNIVIICLVGLECIFSGWAINKDTKFAKYSDIHIVNLLEENAVKSIKNKDRKFYRIGTTTQMNTNDPMTYRYNGLSGYLSQQPTKMVSYLAYLGYFQKYSWYRWTQYNNGSTKAIDSLLNVKYVLAGNQKISSLTNNIGSFPTLNNSESVNRYSKEPDRGNFKVYRNRSVFPFVITSSGGISSYRYNPLDNPFSNYNNLFKVCSHTKLYNRVDIEKDSFVGQGQRLIQGKVQENGLVYFYVARGMNEPLNDIKVKVNGKTYTYAGKNINGENGILCLGRYKNGEDLNVSLTSSNKLKNKIYCYQENEKVLTTISKNQWLSFKKYIKDLNIESNKISFTTNYNENTHLTLPIFNQKGWQVYVNGERENSVTNNFGALLSVKVPKGENNIRIVYKVPGLELSIWISIISVMISVMYFNFIKK